MARPLHAHNEVLPHFIAVEVRGNSPDHPQRWGLIRGERDAVPVPDSVLVLPERASDDAMLEIGGNLDALARRYGPDLDQLRRAAVEEIKEEIEHVREAGRGARPSPTCMLRRGSRACARPGASRSTSRRSSSSAPIIDLTPDEARRERGSTRGVWSWLDRRAPR